MSGSMEARMADVVIDELGRFAAWCGENWTMSAEMARREPELRDVKPGYLDGYDAALAGLPLALECYLEEVRP